MDVPPFAGERLVISGVAIEFALLGREGNQALDQRSQVREHPLAERARAPISLADGVTAAANFLFEQPESVPAIAGRRLRFARLVVGAVLVRRRIDVARVVEIEEGVRGLSEFPIESAIADFQLRDRSIWMLAQPGVCRQQSGRQGLGRRDPSVPLAEDAQEQWPAAIDLHQADRQHLAALRLLLCDPPSQVDIAPHDPPLGAEAAKLRKNKLEQLLALAVHVAERRGHEAPKMRIGCHGIPLGTTDACLRIALRRMPRAIGQPSHLQQTALRQTNIAHLHRPWRAIKIRHDAHAQTPAGKLKFVTNSSRALLPPLDFEAIA